MKTLKSGTGSGSDVLDEAIIARLSALLRRLVVALIAAAGAASLHVELAPSRSHKYLTFGWLFRA